MVTKLSHSDYGREADSQQQQPTPTDPQSTEWREEEEEDLYAVYRKQSKHALSGGPLPTPLDLSGGKE